jgi:predicted Fe-Mo cluster-binding NifX family protein
MIAIPVDSATPGVKSSQLFGNVPMFAIYQPEEEAFFFVRNTASGDGVKTARQLKGWGVERVVYSHMGNGPFGALQKDGVDVYFIGKEPQPLFRIIESLENDNYTKVDATNAKSYLDPGTATGECGCGCTHE